MRKRRVLRGPAGCPMRTIKTKYMQTAKLMQDRAEHGSGGRALFQPCRNRVLENWASALGAAAEAIVERFRWAKPGASTVLAVDKCDPRTRTPVRMVAK